MPSATSRKQHVPGNRTSYMSGGPQIHPPKINVSNTRRPGMGDFFSLLPKHMFKLHPPGGVLAGEGGGYELDSSAVWRTLQFRGIQYVRYLVTCGVLQLSFLFVVAGRGVGARATSADFGEFLISRGSAHCGHCSARAMLHDCLRYQRLQCSGACRPQRKAHVRTSDTSGLGFKNSVSEFLTRWSGIADAPCNPGAPLGPAR